MNKKGINVNILIKSEGKNKKIIFSEILVSIGTYGMAVIQFVSFVFYDRLAHFYFGPYLKILGILFEILGLFVLIKAMIDMNDSWRQGVSLNQKTQLVTNGIYSASRNPAFLGFDVFYIGFTLISPTYLQFIFLFFSIISFHFQILCEEESLVSIFGNEYSNYRKKVPRYLFF